MSVWTQPSPSDIERARDRIAAGEPISEACKAEGFTLTRLRQSDREQWAELKALWHDVQGTEDRHLARETFREIAADTKVEPQHRTSAAVQLGKASGYLTERTTVELTGDGGGPIEVEGRAVVGLADVVRLASELGLGDLVGLGAGDPGGELAAAPHLLPRTAAS